MISTGQYEFDLITATISTTDKTKKTTVIDAITPEMFTQANAKRAWEAVRSLHDENEIVDLSGVFSRMGDQEDMLWLSEVVHGSAALPANLTGYAKRVRQASYLHDARGRAVEALKVIDELTDLTRVDTVAGSIESLFDGLILETNDRKPQLFKDIAKEYTKKIQDKLTSMDEDHVVLTHINDLDHHTGGFNYTDLILIGGTPGSGKTEFAVKMISGVVKNGGSALKFSLEMSAFQVVERSISGSASLPVSKLRNPKLLGDNDWKMLEAGLGELVNTEFYIDDRAGLTIGDIVSTATRHKQNNPNLNIIVVDYAGLLDLPKGERHDIALGAVSRRLKQLAKDLEVPVVLLTQLNSKNINNRPLMDRIPAAADIKDSSRLEDDADLILLCHRQKVHDENAPDVAEIIMAKARHAIKGTRIYFSFVNGHFVATHQPGAKTQMDAYYAPPVKQTFKKSDKLK